MHYALHKYHSLLVFDNCLWHWYITLYCWLICERRCGATEIAGVDNVTRAKKQVWTTREWTTRHEETGVDIARVDNVARRSKVDNAGVHKAARRNRGGQRRNERS